MPRVLLSAVSGIGMLHVRSPNNLLLFHSKLTQISPNLKILILTEVLTEVWKPLTEKRRRDDFNGVSVKKRRSGNTACNTNDV